MSYMLHINTFMSSVSVYLLKFLLFSNNTWKFVDSNWSKSLDVGIETTLPFILNSFASKNTKRKIEAETNGPDDRRRVVVVFR